MAFLLKVPRPSRIIKQFHNKCSPQQCLKKAYNMVKAPLKPWPSSASTRLPSQALMESQYFLCHHIGHSLSHLTLFTLRDILILFKGPAVWGQTGPWRYIPAKKNSTDLFWENFCPEVVTSAVYLEWKEAYGGRMEWQWLRSSTTGHPTCPTPTQPNHKHFNLYSPENTWAQPGLWEPPHPNDYNLCERLTRKGNRKDQYSDTGAGIVHTWKQWTVAVHLDWQLIGGQVRERPGEAHSGLDLSDTPPHMLCHCEGIKSHQRDKPKLILCCTK